MRRPFFQNGKLTLSFLLFSFLSIILFLLIISVADRIFWPPSIDTDLSRSPSVAVVLDPGHGGEDGGAVGKNGVLEKDLNLLIAKEVERNLTSWGFSAFCTRNEDVLLYDKTQDYQGRKKALDLAARLKIARDTPNSIFVSIHMNSFPQAKYSGLQVYYSGNDPRSQELATLVQNEVCRSLQPENTRLIKQASSNIYLLERITSPAILIECGFLSNTEECSKLSTPEYREQLAYAISCAIADYLETHP